MRTLMVITILLLASCGREGDPTPIPGAIYEAGK